MRHTVLVLLLAGAAFANPVFILCFSEVQTAPDSLERVELHSYNGYLPLPVDLYGWRLVTAAGVCTVQTHEYLTDSTSYVVLDRTNLGPNFTLGDERDSLVLLDNGGNYVTETGYPVAAMNQSLAPPPGASAAFHYSVIWQYPDPIEVHGWYVDATPTFGAPNDDTVGGIRGRITDDRGLGVAGAFITASGPTGRLHGWADSSGSYRIHPTGPGTYDLSATCAGHERGGHGDSVTVGVNEWADSIDIVIARTGIAAEPAATTPAGILLRGRDLLLGPGRMTVTDITGRSLLAGSGGRTWNLAALPPGIYLVRLNNGTNTLARKLVLY